MSSVSSLSSTEENSSLYKKSNEKAPSSSTNKLRSSLTEQTEDGSDYENQNIENFVISTGFNCPHELR